MIYCHCLNHTIQQILLRLSPLLKPLAAKRHEGGIWAFGRFLVRDPLAPFLFERVHVPARGRRSRLGEGFRFEERPSMLIFADGRLPVAIGEGDHIIGYGNRVVRKVVSL